MSERSIDEIDPDAVARRIDDGAEFDLVDIRDAGTFAAGHAPGAINLRPPELQAAARDREWADEIVVACYYGESSVQVARFLDAATDADVASMAGGYDAWDGPLVTGERVETSSDR
jgi:rhodanese-related sulfurtransferase